MLIDDIVGMKKFLVLFMTIAGCASVDQIAIRDGKPLYQSNCYRTTADCHKLASEQCNGSYQEVETTRHITQLHIVFACK